MSTLLVLVLGVVGVVHAACPTSTSTAGLTLALEDAEAAFADVDVDGFHLAMDRTAAMLPCLEGLASVDMAARYHRLQGLRAWVLDDQDRARRAFLAARRLEPAWRFPAHMVPEQHPTRAAYLALPLDQVTEVDVDVPAGLRLWVDGRPAERRAEGVPALLQIQDDAGVLHESRYAWPGQPAPAWPAPTPGAETATAGRHPARAPLLVTSIAAAAGAGTMLVLATDARARWEDPATPVAELDGLRSRTNGLLLGAGGAALLSVGAGVGVATTF